MKKFLAVALIFMGMASWGFAQENPVLLTVNNKDVTKSEFEYIFRKNNRDQEISKEALDEYLDLYIKFKLKVTEAEEFRLDTLKKFIDELEGYREQLARPYLVDTDKMDDLIKEAYERSTQEVKAAHLLIKIDQDSKGDTLSAYNRIMDLRKRIVEGGEDFGKMAFAYSDDPSAKKNNGSLGYFSALQMVYPFENAVYKGQVGDVSMPIKTRFGYHLVNVLDKRPARPQVKVAHILVKSNNGDSLELKKEAEKRIREIHAELEAGKDFGTLANSYSDDPRTANKGGELQWIGTHAKAKMFEEFENQAFSLENVGEYSKPFKTKIGWHIVKKLDEKPVKSYKEFEPVLKRKVKKDSRAQLTQISFLNKLKTEYGFQDNGKEMAKIKAAIDTSIYQLDWKAPSTKRAKKILCQYASVKLSVGDFLSFLENNRFRNRRLDLDKYLTLNYRQFVRASLLDYENGHLEEKYPEFKSLMKEYRDGVLLFELTDQKVWSKAVEDTSGLNSYYQQHKNEFMWPERVDLTAYNCQDMKTAKKVRSMVESGKDNSEIQKLINAKSSLNLTIQSGKYVAEEDISEMFEWKKGVSELKTAKNGMITFVVIHDIMVETPKTLKESRGLVTSAYQDYLEVEWVESLRAKYPVEVNLEVLYSIK